MGLPLTRFEPMQLAIPRVLVLSFNTSATLFFFIIIMYFIFQAVKLAGIVTLAKEASVGVTFELPI